VAGRAGIPRHVGSIVNREAHMCGGDRSSPKRNLHDATQPVGLRQRASCQEVEIWVRACGQEERCALARLHPAARDSDGPEATGVAIVRGLIKKPGTSTLFPTTYGQIYDRICRTAARCALFADARDLIVDYRIFGCQRPANRGGCSTPPGAAFGQKTGGLAHPRITHWPAGDHLIVGRTDCRPQYRRQTRRDRQARASAPSSRLLLGSACHGVRPRPLVFLWVRPQVGSIPYAREHARQSRRADATFAQRAPVSTPPWRDPNSIGTKATL
jgi:hypothetical protein